MNFDILQTVCAFFYLTSSAIESRSNFFLQAVAGERKKLTSTGGTELACICSVCSASSLPRLCKYQPPCAPVLSSLLIAVEKCSKSSALKEQSYICWHTEGTFLYYCSVRLPAVFSFVSMARLSMLRRTGVQIWLCSLNDALGVHHDDPPEGGKRAAKKKEIVVQTKIVWPKWLQVL